MASAVGATAHGPGEADKTDSALLAGRRERDESQHGHDRSWESRLRATWCAFDLSPVPRVPGWA